MNQFEAAIARSRSLNPSPPDDGDTPSGGPLVDMLLAAAVADCETFVASASMFDPLAGDAEEQVELIVHRGEAVMSTIASIILALDIDPDKILQSD